MATYLVTGGCGFIGSHLTNELIADGHEVVIIDDLSNGDMIHPEAALIEEDIRYLDRIYPLFQNCDGCFHLAAIPTVEMDLDEWFSIHQVNLTGSLNVFKSAVAAGNIPVVYASSCSVYGEAQELPLCEDQFIKPISAYGCDKLASELNAYFLSHVYQLPSMGMRFFNVYGPGQRANSPYSGVITRFIMDVLNDQPVPIYGDGKQSRDFIFVKDVVSALLQSMKSLKDGADVVNVCTGKSITINQLATMISKLLDKENSVEYLPPRRYDVKHSRGSTKKMQSYKLAIAHNIEQGLKETIDHFRTDV